MTSLAKDEISTCANGIITQHRSKALTIKISKERIQALRLGIEMSDEPLLHTNKALEYALNNKDALQTSIEGSLIQLMKDKAERNGYSSPE